MTLHDALSTGDKATFSVLDKPTLYRMITCSVNVKNEAMVAQWIRYCGEYLRQMELSAPRRCSSDDLRELETEYRCLDLYFQFGRRMSRGYDYEYLTSRKRELEDAIDEQLRGKGSYARRCSECGGVLPYGSRQRMCRACFRKIYTADI
jgi:ribosomal protein S14